MTEWFKEATEIFNRWLTCLWNPAFVQNQILRQDITDSAKIGKSLQLWAAISLLAFIVLLPVYKVGRVEYDDMAFYMPYVIYVLMSQIVIVAGIHISLRIYGVRSRFPETLALHTTTIGAYAPIYSLLQSGLYARLFSEMKDLKANNIPFMKQLDELSFVFYETEGVAALGMIASSVVMVGSAVLLCRSVSDHYRTSRLVVWGSVAFAAGCLLVLSYGIFVAPLYFVLVFTAL